MVDQKYIFRQSYVPHHEGSSLTKKSNETKQNVLTPFLNLIFFKCILTVQYFEAILNFSIKFIAVEQVQMRFRHFAINIDLKYRSARHCFT
jgi:hypothetical protein